MDVTLYRNNGSVVQARIDNKDSGPAGPEVIICDNVVYVITKGRYIEAGVPVCAHPRG